MEVQGISRAFFKCQRSNPNEAIIASMESNFIISSVRPLPDICPLRLLGVHSREVKKPNCSWIRLRGFFFTVCVLQAVAVRAFIRFDSGTTRTIFIAGRGELCGVDMHRPWEDHSSYHVECGNNLKISFR